MKTLHEASSFEEAKSLARSLNVRRLYDGYMESEDHVILFEKGRETKVICVTCNHTLFSIGDVIYCANCKVAWNTVVGRRELSEEELYRLFSCGFIPRLEGFQKKNGERFSARVFLLKGQIKLKDIRNT